jgi:hypothetical protein
MLTTDRLLRFCLRSTNAVEWACWRARCDKVKLSNRDGKKGRLILWGPSRYCGGTFIFNIQDCLQDFTSQISCKQAYAICAVVASLVDIEVYEAIGYNIEIWRDGI